MGSFALNDRAGPAAAAQQGIDDALPGSINRSFQVEAKRTQPFKVRANLSAGLVKIRKNKALRVYSCVCWSPEEAVPRTRIMQRYACTHQNRPSATNARALGFALETQPSR
tara:strand:+ start:378 stop:710 length:333 start_codon:yes stop_codon:yes gene_type:complete